MDSDDHKKTIKKEKQSSVSSYIGRDTKCKPTKFVNQANDKLCDGRKTPPSDDIPRY